MAKTEVILTSNIVGLGGESDHVKVAPGYARNFLFPQRLAIPLTQANKRQIEALQKRRAEREAHEFNTMSELAKGLSNLICVITVKTGDDGKLFGTVTSGMIADQLKNQFDVTLDKRKIHLDHPIKALGEYEVELHLHHEVKSTLKVRVESSTPVATPAEAASAEKAEAPKTEKRGRRTDSPKAQAGDAKAAAPEKGEKPGRAEKPAKGGKAGQSAKSGKGSKE
jgi:large subunit ribosomal protein L9